MHPHGGSAWHGLWIVCACVAEESTGQLLIVTHFKDKQSQAVLAQNSGQSKEIRSRCEKACGQVRRSVRPCVVPSFRSEDGECQPPWSLPACTITACRACAPSRSQSCLTCPCRHVHLPGPEREECASAKHRHILPATVGTVTARERRTNALSLLATHLCGHGWEPHTSGLRFPAPCHVPSRTCTPARLPSPAPSHLAIRAPVPHPVPAPMTRQRNLLIYDTTNRLT